MNIREYIEQNTFNIDEIIKLIPNTKKAAQAHELYLKVNLNGNAKYKNDNRTQFVIWNLPAITTCPYATDKCKKGCYAKRAERYPNVVNSRKRNFINSTQNDFVIRMIYTICTIIKFNKKHKKIIFRVHESGDFYSLNYFVKWLMITERFRDRQDIKFVAYTKSYEFVKTELKKLEQTNFVISLSLWDDSPEYLKKAIQENNYKYYTAFIPELMGQKLIENKNLKKCSCVNCAKCLKCMTYKIKETAVEIH